MSWLSALSATSSANSRASARTRLGQGAEREAQHRQLLAGRREQEIALIAIGIGRAVERPPALAIVGVDDVMAGRQQIGAEILGGLEQVDELHVLVAGDAGDRRLAGDIGARERLDHLLAEARFVVEHVMRQPEPRRDVARVVDVLTGAARALAMRRGAMVVELHRQSDDIVTLARQQRRHDAGIDAARHRDDDARVRRRLGQAQGVQRARRSGGGEPRRGSSSPSQNFWARDTKVGADAPTARLLIEFAAPASPARLPWPPPAAEAPNANSNNYEDCTRF